MAAIKPLLIVSDAVSSGTGLARITADLASNIHLRLSDQYRVATAGAGSGTREFKFMQYNLEGIKDFVCPTLPQIWDDWAGKEFGAVMFIWDLSRLGWFSQPLISDAMDEFPELKRKLAKPNFERWVYAPIDASGPNDRLTFPLMKTVLGFDRVLAYTRFGEGVIRRTIGDEESAKRDLMNIPHGINSDIFFPLDQKPCRKVFFKSTGAQMIDPMTGKLAAAPPLESDEVLIGIVATNQSRKDWAIGIKVASLLSRTRKVRLWIHTDAFERYWSIPSQLIDNGMLLNTVISLGYIPDEKMAEAYSACDLTLGIGPEGFGYPIFESLFCGTPCLTGNYGGAPEYMGLNDDEKHLLVEPYAFREEGEFSSVRPVYRAEDWVPKAEKLIGKRVNHPGELDWKNLAPRWEGWFRRWVR